jgi:predicted DsbA family dithiol-disulfide isomerase
MKTVTIDVVSDVMCPWCYIGKRRLDGALGRLGAGVAVDIRWRPYQLDATLPKEGIDRRLYLERKFGGSARADEIYRAVREAGEMEGIAFDFEAIAVSANTLDAHRLIRWAGETGSAVQSQLVEALFRRYFVEGGHIGEDEVLLAAAREAGLPVASTAAKLKGDLDRESVTREIEEARAMGVTGVPCFILDRKYAIMGAQSSDVLADAIMQVAAERAA